MKLRKARENHSVQRFWGTEFKGSQNVAGSALQEPQILSMRNSCIFRNLSNVKLCTGRNFRVIPISGLFSSSFF